MDHLQIAEQYFKSLGLRLTARARQALAVAIGLAGSPAECDEAFVSLGLRSTNSILSLLADKYDLEFGEIEGDAALHSEAKAEDEIREELRRRGYRDDDFRFLFPERWDNTDWSQVMSIFQPETTDLPQYSGAEGEPDSGLFDELESVMSSPIFQIAEVACRSDNRKMLETFDLLRATTELPLTSAVYSRGHLSEKRLQKEIARYRTLEPYTDRQQILLTFDQGLIRAKSFALLDGYKYEERNISPERIIVQIGTSLPFITSNTFNEFQDLINWKEVSERHIQQFLETHPEFLLGDQYNALHSQLILDRGDKGSLIPDFFAELPYEKQFDLIDLKKPNEQLIVGTKNRRGFSSAVHSAINQLREYRDYFDDSRQRKNFYEKYGLRGWKPRIAVIIGRNPIGPGYDTFIRARRTIFDADIVTYDDIMERAKRRTLTVAGIRQ